MATMMNPNPFGATQTVPNWMNNNITTTPYIQQTQPTIAYSVDSIRAP